MTAAGVRRFGSGALAPAPWLARHPPGGTLATEVPCRVAWLTGQSSYRHSQLSPEQLELLEAVAEVGFAPLRAGFPYHRDALAAAYRREPLLAASMRNGAQYLAAHRGSRGGGFRDEVVRHLAPLVERTSQRLLLLVGSCGLALLSAAVPALPVPRGLRIMAVGLGPVGRRPGPGPAGDRVLLHVIQGRRDWISRLGYRHRPDLRVGTGHSGYTRDRATRAAVLAVAREFAR